ncbi:MAG TPA: hypothetical protein VF715_17805 [Thermoleophilaceae bacterium]
MRRSLTIALLAALAAWPAPAAAQEEELPRGGTRLFPDFRVVAFAGTPGAPALGALGVGPLEDAVRRLRRQARPYHRRGRPVLPALDLIATICSSGPGPDGRFRYRRPLRVVDRHLRAARQARALLLIHIQPGRSTFMEELRPYRRYLSEPDVGIALDPEWRMGPGQRPGQVIGSADADEINAVSAYMDRIVRREGLPQKLLVAHQFTPNMIRRRSRLRQRTGVAVTVSIDGVGSRRLKEGTYRRLARSGDGLYDGFKLFYEEDGRPMTPPQVLALRPQPDFVVYE